MINVFVGGAYHNKPTANLERYQVKDFNHFCDKYLSKCIKGPKISHYIVTGNSYKKTSNKYSRNNASQLSSWLLAFDGDSSISNKDSCIPPKIAHLALKQLNYTHAIHTTHSHVKGKKNRWRLFIPCNMDNSSQLEPTIVKLYTELTEVGITDLKISKESFVWSNPWFLPTRNDPKDGQFEYYTYFNGRPIKPATYKPTTTSTPTIQPLPDKSINEIISVICKGESDTNLHKSTRDLAYGLVKDGVAPATAKAILKGLMQNYSMTDSRQKENYGKVEPLVDSAYEKMKGNGNLIEVSDAWKEKEAKVSLNYTKFPDQGGMMEEIVQACISYMHNPNREIAVVASHALISALSGRVYGIERTRGGVTFNVMITGRSGIGKDWIKKFCQFALNNFQLAGVAQQFFASMYYTSVKNLVEELVATGTLLVIKTESGQFDKSQAGDMSRLLAYELSLISGPEGFVLSGGQNDKVPAIHNPSVTIVRESTADAQLEADATNKVHQSGLSGRRSHVFINPIKASSNKNRLYELPPNIKELLKTLYKLYNDTRRHNPKVKMSPDYWKLIPYHSSINIDNKKEEWKELENLAAIEGDDFVSTYYARFNERNQAYAGRLAIVDNPDNPIINKNHFDIAEASLKSELEAYIKSDKSSGFWDTGIKKLVKLFSGDLTQKKALSHRNTTRMLKDGIIQWSDLREKLKMVPDHKTFFDRSNFMKEVESRLEPEGIVKVSREELEQKYKIKSRKGTYYRRT